MGQKAVSVLVGLCAMGLLVFKRKTKPRAHKLGCH